MITVELTIKVNQVICMTHGALVAYDVLADGNVISSDVVTLDYPPNDPDDGEPIREPEDDEPMRQAA